VLVKPKGNKFNAIGTVAVSAASSLLIQFAPEAQILGVLPADQHTDDDRRDHFDNVAEKIGMRFELGRKLAKVRDAFLASIWRCIPFYGIIGFGVVCRTDVGDSWWRPEAQCEEQGGKPEAQSHSLVSGKRS
jgi:hypothetical protein